MYSTADSTVFPTSTPTLDGRCIAIQCSLILSCIKIVNSSALQLNIDPMYLILFPYKGPIQGNIHLYPQVSMVITLRPTLTARTAHPKVYNPF